jgi:CheY-like chemotaxis protein
VRPTRGISAGVEQSSADPSVPSAAAESHAALKQQLRDIQDALGAVIRDSEYVALDPAFLDAVRATCELAPMSAQATTAIRPVPSVPRAVTAPAAVQEPPAEQKPRVLIADDTPIALKALRGYLKHLGYEVVAVENGKLALDKALESPADYDAVFTDLEMPEMDGFELLERLKADPRTRDIPVVVVSGLDDVASVVRCIRNGAEDHLVKPYDEVILGARAKAVIDRKRLRDREVAYLQRVERVTAAAKAAEAGTYTTGALGEIASEADELGRLARVFDSLVTSVKERESRLQSRLRSLRQEVHDVRATVGDRVSPEARNPALPSDTFFAGRYKVINELGRGGMGMVYRARDLELQEDVAIKTLRPGMLADDPTLGERFKTELRLARSLAHPNVVRTYDFGLADDVHYMTMELVKGITLRELIDVRGQLGIESTLAAGLQLAEALAAAHAQGMIHRDIKPENLLLDDRGTLKVMDFGVARPATATHLTEAGFIVGTPSYMAPEHLFGESIDARADLYAAGVVLYECLTGVLPFQASNPFALARRVSTEDAVPPEQRNGDVPAALSAIVMQLLAKKRDDRVPSADVLAAQLRALH